MGSNIDSKNKLANGAILIISMILKHVMSSAAEAEIGSVFLTAREATILRTFLEEMGHPQPPTPLQTDSTTATGYSNDTIKQRRTRAIDMRLYWFKDRVKQGQFHVYWGPGYQNLADYFTKHHSPTHHKRIRIARVCPYPRHGWLELNPSPLWEMICLPRGYRLYSI
jgi:hypothetical protein